ncbi:hypothetical protein GpartN1_g1581.t1 [Galdieria partita]|uniref:Hemerythrin-like domain-containing protein n=1 Tax=Galdieria partita TaxID=83374 RepID=A0A9C7UNS5_9RHOD|nr:hypothetical protein GpartN1_g1581.t1 [Galdieria partita]
MFSTGVHFYEQSPYIGSLNDDSCSSDTQNGWRWELFSGKVIKQPSPAQVSSSSDPECSTTAEETSEFEAPFVWDNSIVSLQVELKQPLLFDAERNEFSWLKAWRLPEIRVLLKRTLEPWKESTIKVLLVCASNTWPFFEQVKLLGDCSAQAVGGECRFPRLRLTTTSSSLCGRKFHIVIAIFSSTAKCEAALISTGFAVYSRSQPEKTKKRAHLTSPENSEKSLTSRLFSPDLFEKEFIKKFRAQGQEAVDEVIDNSILGLVRYFQATNIRHKCRNPLFLAIRFSKVLAISRDSTILPIENEDCYWSLFQALGLYHPVAALEVPLSIHTSPSGTPVWFLSIREPQNMTLEVRKFVVENVGTSSLGHVGFANDMSLLPVRFKTLDNIQQLKRVYEKMFILESRLSNVGRVKLSIENNENVTGKLSSHELEESLSEVENNSHGKSPSSESAVSERNLNGQDDFASSFFDLYREPCNAETNQPSFHEHISRDFICWFQQLHKDLRKSLEKMNHYSSQLVMKPNVESFQELKTVCDRFRRSLRIHSFIEDHTLFYEIGKRLPGLVEAYHLDHNMESGEVKAIVDMVNTFDPQYAGDLFLRITGFSSQFLFHMEKEEEHLVPRLLNVMTSEELSDLFVRLRNEIASLEVNSE